MAEDNDKSPLDRLAEIVVFAPLGAAAMAREMLPEVVQRLVERGREELEQTTVGLQNQISVLRDVGEAGARLVRRRLGGERTAAEPTAAAAAVSAEPGAGEAAIRRAQAVAGRTLQEAGRRAAEAEAVSGGNGQAEAAQAKHRADVAEARAEAEGLAIPDYESLSAAQVNARLGALTSEELEAVREYEETHRGRRSILARVESLLSQ